jgi:hypothetical protein
MKITAVRYRKLISLPGYENKAIEAEAAVEPNEAPEDALLLLSQWVHEQLSGEKAVTDLPALRQEVAYLHGKRHQLRTAVATAEAEKRKLHQDIADLEVKREKAGGPPVMPF